MILMKELELLVPSSYDFYIRDLRKEDILKFLNQYDHLNSKKKARLLQLQVIVNAYKIEHYVYTMTEHKNEKIIRLINLYINGVFNHLLDHYQLKQKEKEKIIDQFLKYVYDLNDCDIDIKEFPYQKLSEWLNDVYSEYFDYGELYLLKDLYFKEQQEIFKAKYSPVKEKKIKEAVKKTNDKIIEEKNKIPQTPNYDLLLLYVEKAKNNYTLIFNLYNELSDNQNVVDPLFQTLIFNEYLLDFYSNYMTYTEGSMFSVDKANHIVQSIQKHKNQNKEVELTTYYTKDMPNMEKYIGEKTYWSPNKVKTSTEAIQIFNNHFNIFNL